MRQRDHEPVVDTKARTRGSPGKSDGGAGRQLNDATTAFHFDSVRVAWIHADDRALATDAEMQMKTPIEDRECKHTKCFRPVRGENNATSASLYPNEAPLHEVDAARHGR